MTHLPQWNQKRWCIVSLAILCAGVMIAYAGRSQAHAAQAEHHKQEAFWLNGSWPHEGSDLSPHPSAVFGRLDNGFRYVLLHHDTPKGRTVMQLDVQAGSLMERENEAGIAHYMEHMVFNGSTHFAPGKLITYFQKNGMSFGGDTNAHTAMQETVFKLNLPQNSNEEIQKGLTVLSDFARGALILEQEVSNERGVILEEKTARDTIQSRARQRRLDRVYGGTRFTDPTIGKEQIIRGANAKLLRGFYEAWYRPELTVLVMVGDFDPHSIEPLVRWTFADFRAKAPRREVPKWGDISSTSPVAFYDPKSGSAPLVMVERLHPRHRPQDSVTLQRRELAEQLAAKILRDRLMTLCASPKAPALKAFSRVSMPFSQFKNAGMMAMPKNGDWKSALSLLENELRRATTYGFTEQEFQRAKQFFMTAIRRNIMHEKAESSQSIAEEIIACLNSGRVYQSAKQSMALYAPMLKDMSKAEAEGALKRLWSTGKHVVSLTGLPIASSTPEKTVLDVWNAASNVPVSAWKDHVAQPFPYLKASSHVAQVTAQDEHSELPETFAFRHVDFDNGMTLYMKPSTVEKRRVELSLMFGRGLDDLTPREQKMAQLVNKCVAMTGPGKLTRVEFMQALGGKSIQLNLGTRASSHVIAGSSLNKDLPLLLHGMKSILLDQHIRQSDLDSALSLLQSEETDRTGTASGLMRSKGFPFMSGGVIVPALTYKEAQQFTLAELQDFLKKELATGKLTFTAAGDFAPDALQKQIGQIFGDQKRAAYVSTAQFSNSFPAGQHVQARLTGELQQAGVLIGYAIPGPASETAQADDPALLREIRYSILTKVLSDRMRIQIREKLGAAYSPFAFSWTRPDFAPYGIMCAYATTDAGKEQLVSTKAQRILDTVADSGITQDELDRAQRQLLAARINARKKLSFWSMLLQSESTLRKGTMARQPLREKIIKESTVDDMNTLAKELFSSSRRAQFTVLPQK